MRVVERHLPSPPMAVALLALFVALGGAGYAATMLPRNSVGTKQLKKNAVTGSKVKRNALTGADVKESTLKKVPSAARADNAASAANAVNAANATNAANAAALEGRHASDFAPSAPEPFHNVGSSGEPAFEHSWANYGGGFATAAFYKDPYGVVHLKGTITGGTVGSSAFTLPPGYRPSENLFMTCATGGTTDCWLGVFTGGEVVPQAGVANWGLDGQTFRAG